MIDPYTDSSPNGFKAGIALEALGLPYKVHHLRIDAGERRRPDYLRIQPQGRIPAIRDQGAGGRIVFESGAIPLYLAERTGRLLPADPEGLWDAVVWLFVHASSTGPILGQCVHLETFAERPIPEAIDRYRRLTEDAFAELDRRLADRPFLAGGEYSIADTATFSWTHIRAVSGVGFGHHRSLAACHERVAARPAVQRSVVVPAKATGP